MLCTPLAYHPVYCPPSLIFWCRLPAVSSLPSFAIVPWIRFRVRLVTFDKMSGDRPQDRWQGAWGSGRAEGDSAQDGRGAAWDRGQHRTVEDGRGQKQVEMKLHCIHEDLCSTSTPIRGLFHQRKKYKEPGGTVEEYTVISCTIQMFYWICVYFLRKKSKYNKTGQHSQCRIFISNIIQTHRNGQWSLVF